MKKYRVFTASIVIAIVMIVQISAVTQKSNVPINWYIRNNNDHAQPEFGLDLSFVADHGAVYIDKEHGDKNAEKVIYLTFDAGYENGNVEKILDVMKKYDVKGAFFVLENLIKSNTDLVKRMADEGHLVCNHTMNHKNMSQAKQEEFNAELLGLENLYREKTGYELAKFYRPPEGCFSAENLDWACELGYTTVFWSFAYADWDNGKQMSCEKAIDKVLSHTHNGEIILLHPTSETNAAIIDRLISSWKAEGYTFGTLNDLVK